MRYINTYSFIHSFIHFEEELLTVTFNFSKQSPKTKPPRFHKVRFTTIVIVINVVIVRFGEEELK